MNKKSAETSLTMVDDSKNKVERVDYLYIRRETKEQWWKPRGACICSAELLFGFRFGLASFSGGESLIVR